MKGSIFITFFFIFISFQICLANKYFKYLPSDLFESNKEPNINCLQFKYDKEEKTLLPFLLPENTIITKPSTCHVPGYCDKDGQYIEEKIIRSTFVCQDMNGLDYCVAFHTYPMENFEIIPCPGLGRIDSLQYEYYIRPYFEDLFVAGTRVSLIRKSALKAFEVTLDDSTFTIVPSLQCDHSYYCNENGNPLPMKFYSPSYECNFDDTLFCLFFDY